MNNVFYFKKIGVIGGCESWFYYLSKLYKDMIIYYKEGNPEQIKRLAHNVEVRRYQEGEIIKCNNFFCCYNPDIIDNVEAKHYFHVIHCDYKNVWFKPILHPKFDTYIAVSKQAGESFKELTGIDYELIYNPVAIDIPKVEKYNDGKLHIISATRLTKEKGLLRMKKMAKLLEDNNIDYVWEVYTNKVREVVGKNVIYKDPKFNIVEEIAKADYLVQLSNCEAFCYSIVESLMVGTPIIATDLPVLKELGIRNDFEGYILDFNMQNVPIDQIKEKSLKVAYKCPKSNWGKYLKETSDYNPNDKIKVRTKKGFYLLDEDIDTIRGQEIEITKERASYLEAKDLVVRI
jgi:glycosyltransferase involved in cell wall biosynthesis